MGRTAEDRMVARIEKDSFSHVLLGESIKAAGKGRSNHRARNRRGSRARASKDTSKLLLLYDEDILDRDPLREQKDLAFAQAYLTRVGNTAAIPAFLYACGCCFGGRYFEWKFVTKAGAQ